jgi:hypothetical protein
MRKLLVLFLICSSAFAQNYWQNEITLNSIPSYCKINSCVSSKGIHIVYTHNGGVKYALSRPDGSIIKQDKVIENEGAGCSLPNVVSINNEVYAIYIKSNNISVAKSTDLGDTWNVGYSHYPLTNTNCNALVILLENDHVHMTWSENRTTWGTDVHYVCFYYTYSPTQWYYYKRVTDVESAGGEMPAIALSQDRVHISYKTNSLFAKTRDMFRSDNTWQSSSQLITDVLPGTVLSYLNVFSINNQLHAVLRQDYGGGGNPTYRIKHYLRSTDNVTWQQKATNLATVSSVPMISAKTQNNRIHIIYFDKNENNFIHRYLEDTTWSSKINNVGFYYSPTLNADGNDLYLTYNNDELTPSAVMMRRYDDSLLVPANFTLTPSQNWHPYLTWSLNTQADIQNYYLERSEKSIIPGSQWTNWEILPAIASTQNYYEDLTINNASGAGPMLVRYRLRVKDYYNYSDYTNNLQMAYGTSAEKRMIQNNNTITNYSLMQNYPNPFNPSTNISYQLPEPGLVQLKVYDLLGKEVASLVNEFKPEGEYSINYNASGLPSGVYIYLLRVNGFVQNQKMTLMK